MDVETFRKILEEENGKINQNIDSKHENLKKKLDEVIESNVLVMQEVNLLKRKVNYLETKDRLKNIIMEGLDEDCINTRKNLESEVIKVFKKDMKLDITIKDVDFIRRLSGNKVKIGFTRYIAKLDVLEARGKLRGKSILIYEDMDVKEREITRKLVPLMKKAREYGNHAIIKSGKLIINGKPWTQAEAEKEFSKKRPRGSDSSSGLDSPIPSTSQQDKQKTNYKKAKNKTDDNNSEKENNGNTGKSKKQNNDNINNEKNKDVIGQNDEGEEVENGSEDEAQ